MRVGIVWALACVLVLGLAVPGFTAEGDKKIVFVAGTPSHAPGDHEHRAGCMLLAKKLEETIDGLTTEVTHYGWPKDESIFEGADTVVLYCDGGAGHMANPHHEKVKSMMDSGVGLVCLHYAVEFPKGKTGDRFIQLLGGYFEPHWSVNPHWKADFKEIPNHPITKGVTPFRINDEWYFNMRFMPDMKGVTPILSAVPPASTMNRDDGPHSGNPAVRKMVEAGEQQHVAWAYERPEGGRSFGFTGGHYHKTWLDNNARKLVLNAILWTANMEVPDDGVNSTTPTMEEMKANLDKKGR